MPPEGVLLAFPAGPHDDHPRRIVATTADSEEHPHPELAGAVWLDDVDPTSVLRRGADVEHGLAVDRVAVAGTDRESPSRGQLTGRRHGRAVALGSQLAERGEGTELAARPPIELIERPVEGGFADNRNGQDIGLDV